MMVRWFLVLVCLLSLVTLADAGILNRAPAGGPCAGGACQVPTLAPVIIPPKVKVLEVPVEVTVKAVEKAVEKTKTVTKAKAKVEAAAAVTSEVKERRKPVRAFLGRVFRRR